MPAQEPLIQPHPAVHFALLDGESVLLQAQTEEYYTLDETSTRMWQLLEQHGRVDQVVIAMLQEFSIDKQTLNRDLNNFINDCLTEQLLVRS